MADFGFAKYVGADKTYTICGTPDYQAPEVCVGVGGWVGGGGNELRSTAQQCRAAAHKLARAVPGGEREGAPPPPQTPPRRT